MTKNWAPLGAANVKFKPIDRNLGAHIRLELRSKKISNPSPAFFDALSLSISVYEANTELKEQSRPAKVRENLQKAIDAALGLNDTLQNLDGFSRQLITKIEEGGVAKLQNAYLQRILDSLHEASHLADELPKAGRIVEHARLLLAFDIANAMKVHLGVTPTTTKEGLFSSLLVIVLAAASGKQVSNVSSLARRALALEVRRFGL